MRHVGLAVLTAAFAVVPGAVGASEAKLRSSRLHSWLRELWTPLKVEPTPEALSGGGGPGILDAQRILLRAGSAALLNAAGGVEGDSIPALEPGEVIDMLNEALASDDRQAMLDLASYFGHGEQRA